MMSIRSLADFNGSSLGGAGDWQTPPPSPSRAHAPGQHDERGMGTFTWPPARTSSWPPARTFSWPRTQLVEIDDTRRLRQAGRARHNVIEPKGSRLPELLTVVEAQRGSFTPARMGLGRGKLRAIRAVAGRTWWVARPRLPRPRALTGPASARRIRRLLGEPGCDLGARGEAKLGEDVLDVGFRSALGDDKRCGDLLVPEALSNEPS